MVSVCVARTVAHDDVYITACFELARKPAFLVAPLTERFQLSVKFLVPSLSADSWVVTSHCGTAVLHHRCCGWH